MATRTECGLFGAISLAMATDVAYRSLPCSRLGQQEWPELPRRQGVAGQGVGVLVIAAENRDVGPPAAGADRAIRPLRCGDRGAPAVLATDPVQDGAGAGVDVPSLPAHLEFAGIGYRDDALRCRAGLHGPGLELNRRIGGSRSRLLPLPPRQVGPVGRPGGLFDEGPRGGLQQLDGIGSVGVRDKGPRCCGVEPVGMGVLTKAIRLPSGENVGLLAVASAMISRGVVAPGASTYIPGEAPLIRAKAIRPAGDTAGS